jgi:Lrp/AsnC family transcriptional regulator for asnA, asnC and gidA
VEKDNGRVLDLLDRRIISELQDDGRRTLTDIGSALGVSHVTVRNRLDSLLSQGLLEVRGFVNPDALGLKTEAIIGIRADITRVAQLADSLGALEEVTFSGIITGRYDLMIAVAVESDKDLLDFMATKLAPLEGIREMETFHVLSFRKRRVHWKVPGMRVGSQA